MAKKKGLLAALLTILLTSFVCVWLYQWDNKYTKTDTQPINGVLFYSEENELSYLTRQWILYPDVLLTPEDAMEYSGYRCYTDITNQSSHGYSTMTYQLTLLLPEDAREYALELPEVFSSCKLYVNEHQVLQLGDPSPDSYKEGLRSQIVTFSASGETKLLLAVSDFSKINAGLTYPPAFGTPDAVFQARETRMLLHGGLALLALISALLAVSFGMGIKKSQGIMTFLLCICLIIITGYPLYHGMFVTKVQPWYTVEPVCYYALLLFALMLQLSIYETKEKPGILLITPGIIGLLFTILRFSLAGILPTAVSTIFSYISTGLKYYTAFCILGLSLWALLKKKGHSALLLCGSAALASCLIWDRILPLYEPIYGGWFGEVGGVLLVISLGIALWGDAIDAYRFRLTHEESLQQMQERLVLQKEHYHQLSSQVQSAQKSSHDLRHHMRTMNTLAQQRQWERLQHYLKEYETHIYEQSLHIRSEHPIADAILNRYALAAKEINAEYDVRITISPNLPFPDDELCIILSNLLENALDAVSHPDLEKRKIYLRGEVIENRLGIVVDNTYYGGLKKKEDVFLSTKHAGHGLGISSVRTIAEKHGGLVDFEGKDGIFHVSILIPLPSENE